MSNRPPKPIVCTCAACGGRAWTHLEIRALPGMPPNKPISALQFPSINRLTGHAFAYAQTEAIGAWHKRGDDAPAAAPAAPPAPRRFETGPRPSDDPMPINAALRYRAVDGPAPAEGAGVRS